MDDTKELDTGAAFCWVALLLLIGMAWLADVKGYHGNAYIILVCRAIINNILGTINSGCCFPFMIVY